MMNLKTITREEQIFEHPILKIHEELRTNQLTSQQNVGF